MDGDIVGKARELRARQTKAERLLWALLRARQLCDLKFRRQHPAPPYIADFACVAHNVIVMVVTTIIEPKLILFANII